MAMDYWDPGGSQDDGDEKVNENDISISITLSMCSLAPYQMMYAQVGQANCIINNIP